MNNNLKNEVILEECKAACDSITYKYASTYGSFFRDNGYETEDINQMLLLNAFDKMKYYDENKGDIKNFLCKVSANYLNTHIRKNMLVDYSGSISSENNRAYSTTTNIEFLNEEITEEKGYEDVVCRKTIEDIFNHLNEINYKPYISSKYKDYFKEVIIHLYEGDRVVEIAKKINQPISTTHFIIKKAREIIKNGIPNLAI